MTQVDSVYDRIPLATTTGVRSLTTRAVRAPFMAAQLPDRCSKRSGLVKKGVLDAHFLSAPTGQHVRIAANQAAISRSYDHGPEAHHHYPPNVAWPQKIRKRNPDRQGSLSAARQWNPQLHRPLRDSGGGQHQCWAIRGAKEQGQGICCRAEAAGGSYGGLGNQPIVSERTRVDNPAQGVNEYVIVLAVAEPPFKLFEVSV